MLQPGTGSLQDGTSDGVLVSGKMGNGAELRHSGVELRPSTAIWDGDRALNSHHLKPFLLSTMQDTSH